MNVIFVFYMRVTQCIYLKMYVCVLYDPPKNPKIFQRVFYMHNTQCILPNNACLRVV